jgi:hypothetical protein
MVQFSEKSVDKLTEIGVDGVTERRGRDRSMLKFTQEQRHILLTITFVWTKETGEWFLSALHHNRVQ